MYTQDKITSGGEITSAGKFSIKEGFPFYLFAAPKTDTAGTVAIFNATLVYGKQGTPVPITAGMWGPVVFKEVEITSDLLSTYRIFWGKEEA